MHALFIRTAMPKHALIARLPPLHTPPWLRGGNIETLYAKSLQSAAPPYRRELLPNHENSGMLAFDFLDSPHPDAPLLLHFHGLEGSSRSHYAVALMLAAQARGWHAAVAHFSSCGGVAAQKYYHSGDTEAIAHALKLMQARYPRIYAVGVSLGGNALAKYLGECGRANISCGLQAAAAVSAPVDLTASSLAISQGLPRLLYTPYFLSSLRKKVPADAKAVKLRSLADFDNAYTAPLNGFIDAADYYRRAAAKPYRRDIRLPTLLINAHNDPFLPPEAMPQEAEVSPQVYLLQPRSGGHVGFVSGTGRGHLRWMPETVFRFFDEISHA